MILIEFLTAPGCSECEKAKIVLDEIKKLYSKIDIKEIDVMSLKGFAIAAKYGIMVNPGVIINEKLFSVGTLNKGKLITEIKNRLK